MAGSGNQAVVDGVGMAASFDDLRGLTYYAGHVYMLDANGAASVHLTGCDANFRTHSEFSTISELGRRIVQNDC